MRSLAILALSVAPAAADTPGYLPDTPSTQDLIIMQPAGADRLIVARSQREWASAWQSTYGRGTPPEVDFARDMVIGVVAPDRLIYRVQLDSVAQPKELEVYLRVTRWPGQTIFSPRSRRTAHFVVTPRSALPVHANDESPNYGICGFPEDACIDLGTAPGGARPNGKLELREDAEHAVFETLTAAERAHLAPGAPAVLAVERDAKHWTITYDELTFEVDIATGAVKRRTRP